MRTTEKTTGVIALGCLDPRTRSEQRREQTPAQAFATPTAGAQEANERSAAFAALSFSATSARNPFGRLMLGPPRPSPARKQPSETPANAPCNVGQARKYNAGLGVTPEARTLLYDRPLPDRRSLRRRVRAGDPSHNMGRQGTMRHWITSFQLVEHERECDVVLRSRASDSRANYAGEEVFSRLLCQASINCRTVAAVSSMERRVTSITGHPWLVHRRRAQSSSFFTASSST